MRKIRSHASLSAVTSPLARGVWMGGLVFAATAGLSCAQPATPGQPAAGQRGSLTVRVNQPGVKISPMFYGLMTEEINHSYDGGLYAELIQNRDLKDNEKQPSHWSLVQKSGTGSLALDPTQPVPNTALTHCLRLDVKNAQGPLGVGASNDGYWGVPVATNTTYRVSFYAKARPGYTGNVSLALENTDGSQAFGRATVPQLTSEWKKYDLTISGGAAPLKTVGRFTVYATGTGTVYLTHVSVMPPTYKNRPNGNRPDLMQMMTDMNQSFLRMPGGNYLEGDTIPTRFDWKTTLGPTEGRPGHMGTWGYRSSDGLGLLEFLHWCEDINVEPILAVYGGYSLRGDYVKPGADLQPYVDDALDEIEYLIGAAKTKWGARRIADGHPAPYRLRYVEIGNEDWFDRSGSYDARFAQFHNAIKAKYPQLQTIASANVKGVRPDVIDDHYYRSAAAMAGDAHHYDNYDRTGPKIFVGEWASTEGSPTPTLMAALGDAAWLTGLERNSDHVIMECYAPLLVNVNRGASQWGTNLIGYDAATAFGSPAYYVQKMFANNKGDTVLPVDVQAASAATVAAPRGGVGVGTWLTQAEYRNIKVTGPNGQALMQSDFGAGGAKAGDWTPKTGEWRVQDGAFRQTGNGEKALALSGDPNWGDYTMTLQARKLSGDEGFLVLVHAKDEGNFVWWNIGGWGNTRSALEKSIGGSKSQLGPDSPIKVENGRWYNIRVEVKGNLIRCFLDDKLINEVRDVPPSAMYATSSRDSASGDIILKVVNMSSAAQSLQINLQGAQGVGGTATATILSGQPTDVNTVDAPTKVAPRTATVTGASANFPYTFLPYSTTVMRLKARR